MSSSTVIRADAPFSFTEACSPVRKGRRKERKSRGRRGEKEGEKRRGGGEGEIK